jgi:CubicO group peptidase (beta-lactamase class C family)
LRNASVALALLLAACATAPRDTANEAHALLSGLAADKRFQGAVVLARGGRVVYEGAFGFADVERQVPFTLDTRSDGGSIAKTFTSAAVLLLAHEGRVDLDAPVARYLPDYPHEATRVRHLISNTAALPGYDWFDDLLGPGTARTNASQLALVRARGQPPAFVPGTRFVYDNVGYDTAALLVGSASGMGYEAYLRERFFRPLGIEPFVRPARLADFTGVRTRGYRRTAQGYEPFDAVEGEGFHGGGNLYVSARDLHRWAQAWATRQALPPAAHARAIAPATLDDGRATGLSWSSWYCTRGGDRGYYRGDHNGFHVFTYWDARGTTAVFVSNGGTPNAMKPQIARALVALAEGGAIEPVRAQSPVEGSLAGSWRFPGLGEVPIAESGHLRVGGVEYPSYPAGRGVRYAPGLDATLHLEAADGGEPALHWTSVCYNARGVRAP